MGSGFRSQFLAVILKRRRLFSSSTLSSDPPAIGSSSNSKEAREALSRLRSERNPDRITQICRSLALKPDSHIDRIAYSKAVSKLKDANDNEGIRSFIRESMARLDCISERAASHFIILYGKGGLMGDAVKLFEEMPEMGIERNIKTLNSLLFSCVLAREYSEMKRIFTEFPRRYGLEPNFDTYNIALKGFCVSGSANMAHSILAEMERKGIRPTKATFASAIAGFYQEEKLTDVGEMRLLMRRYGVEQGITIYNVRIQSLCKLGRTREAKALLDGILSRNMKPNSVTYSHLIHGFCKQGDLHMAKSLYREMVAKVLNPDYECYTTMAYYLCQGGDFEAAFVICKACIGNTGKVPNISTMTTLVRGLIRIGKLEDAREIIKQMKGKFSRNAECWKRLEDELPNEI